MPSVSALVLARLLAAKGNFPTLYGTPCGGKGQDCQRLRASQESKATAQLSGWGSTTHLLHKAVTSDCCSIISPETFSFLLLLFHR